MNEINSLCSSHYQNVRREVWPNSYEKCRRTIRFVTPSRIWSGVKKKIHQSTIFFNNWQVTKKFITRIPSLGYLWKGLFEVTWKLCESFTPIKFNGNGKEKISKCLRHLSTKFGFSSLDGYRENASCVLADLATDDGRPGHDISSADIVKQRTIALESVPGLPCIWKQFDIKNQDIWTLLYDDLLYMHLTVNYCVCHCMCFCEILQMLPSQLCNAGLPTERYCTMI